MSHGHLVAGLLAILGTAPLAGQEAPRPRARDAGVRLPGEPGPLNAITDVPGVLVGHVTLIRGDGRRVVGRGPVRTGVTAILPRGRDADPVMAGWWTLNGNGEMTGTTWVQESGFLGGPVLLTNTLAVGAVHEGVIRWGLREGLDPDLVALPVVAETWDGGLHDILGLHVRPEHAIAAIDSARGGRVAEGNVGGGTGMRCHEFKGGIGTSSRRVPIDAAVYTVGVLVQCNYGSRRRLTIAGVPVGAGLSGATPCTTIGDAAEAWIRRLPRCDAAPGGAAPAPQEEIGSIIVVVATDAPLLPHQLTRVARRAALGIGRMGGIGGDSSGDIMLAFSTANRGAAGAAEARLAMVANGRLNGIFEAAVDATEEAITNALFAATTMTGADGLRLPALPLGPVLAQLRQAGAAR